jgi:hypothetical protein
MIHYIIQVLLFQTLFLAVYDLFLKKETFFQWNRAYLIVSSILAYIIPFIKIESATTYVQENFAELPAVMLNPEIIFLTEVNLAQENTNLFTLQNFYILGIAITFFLFIYKISLIFIKIYQNTILRKKDYNLVILPKQQTAFSFFKYLFLGKSLFEKEHQHIIKHELTHIKQKHSIDLIYFELQKIIFWVNPFSYLFQNRISALHEYIADAKTIKEENKQSFFESLLNQTFQIEKFSFINQFYKKSLIKKRIIMATKNKSKEILKLKYFLVVPIVLLMLGFTSIITQKNTNIIGKNITDSNENSASTYTVEEHIDRLINTPLQNNNISKEEINPLIKREQNIDYVKDTVSPNENKIYKLGELDEYPYLKNTTITNNKERGMELMKIFIHLPLDHFEFHKKNEKNFVVPFIINSSGKITNINYDDVPKKYLANIKEIIDMLPDNIVAGRKNGKPISTKWSLMFFKKDGSLSNNISTYEKVEYIEDVPFSVIDEVPVYPGCSGTNEDLKKCMSKKITQHVSKNFNINLAQKLGLSAGKKRISVQFKIDKDGNTANIKVRAPHPKLQEEAKRIIKLLPKMQPGKQDGKAVNVRYNLPIVFNVEE